MKNKQTKINYADLWGLREEKYKFLEENDVKTTKWQELQPKEQNYFFVPKDFRLDKQYGKFWLLTDIFKFHSVGGKPGDDNLLVNYNEIDLKVKVRQFAELLKIDPAKATKEARRNLLRIINNFEVQDEKVIQYNYRPFDIRYSYYDERIYTRPVTRIKEQFGQQNVALLTTKILKAEPFSHIFISTVFPDVIFLSNKTSTNTFVFPFYLYHDGEKQQTFFAGQEKLDLEGTQHTLRHKSNKEPNINSKLLDVLRNTFGKILNPEEVCYYIYTILYSNVYRKKYQEFLKIDFPRIPFTKDYNLFKKLAELGEQLVNLHLLKSSELENPISKFHGRNGNRAEKREYNEKEKRVCINNQQYFENIEPQVWNYYIGGYQVLDKWLKDRKDRSLSSEDIKHYCKVVSALSRTIEIQKSIDELYPGIEKSLI